MSEVEFLVKLRDAAAMIAEACEGYLGTKAPTDIREVGDFETLKWIEKGDANPYQQTKKADNTDNLRQFQILQEKLREKNGFWQTRNCKFWFHMNDQDTIDRRRK